MLKYPRIILALFVFMVGCDQETQWHTITPDSESPLPGVFHVEDCWDHLELADLQRAIVRIDCCRDVDPCDASSICHQNAIQQVPFDVDNFYQCILNLPSENVDCLAMLDPQDPDSDADGDGVMDMVEIRNRTNPCHICTYGPHRCDGEMDFDEDGIPNNEDPLPGCGDHCYGPE